MDFNVIRIIVGLHKALHLAVGFFLGTGEPPEEQLVKWNIILSDSRVMKLRLQGETAHGYGNQ